MLNSEPAVSVAVAESFGAAVPLSAFAVVFSSAEAAVALAFASAPALEAASQRGPPFLVPFVAASVPFVAAVDIALAVFANGAVLEIPPSVADVAGSVVFVGVIVAAEESVVVVVVASDAAFAVAAAIVAVAAAIVAVVDDAVVGLEDKDCLGECLACAEEVHVLIFLDPLLEQELFDVRQWLDAIATETSVEIGAVVAVAVTAVLETVLLLRVPLQLLLH